jgi:uncharacterized protein YnzC (UPF0291/DUF896 family)
MKTIELKLNELLTLLTELEGFRMPDSGEVIFKGFINHSLSLKDKFWLTKLINNLTQEKQEIEKLRNQLIEKFGEKDNESGSISIPMTITDKKGENIQNPKFLQFQKEYQELLNETKTIEYKPITLETLESISTEDNYLFLFKLVEEGE